MERYSNASDLASKPQGSDHESASHCEALAPMTRDKDPNDYNTHVSVAATDSCNASLSEGTLCSTNYADNTAFAYSYGSQCNLDDNRKDKVDSCDFSALLGAVNGEQGPQRSPAFRAVLSTADEDSDNLPQRAAEVGAAGGGMRGDKRKPRRITVRSVEGESPQEEIESDGSTTPRSSDQGGTTAEFTPGGSPSPTMMQQHIHSSIYASGAVRSSIGSSSAATDVESSSANKMEKIDPESNAWATGETVSTLVGARAGEESNPLLMAGYNTGLKTTTGDSSLKSLIAAGLLSKKEKIAQKDLQPPDSPQRQRGHSRWLHNLDLDSFSPLQRRERAATFAFGSSTDTSSIAGGRGEKTGADGRLATLSWVAEMMDDVHAAQSLSEMCMDVTSSEGEGEGERTGGVDGCEGQSQGKNDESSSMYKMLKDSKGIEATSTTATTATTATAAAAAGKFRSRYESNVSRDGQFQEALSPRTKQLEGAVTESLRDMLSARRTPEEERAPERVLSTASAGVGAGDSFGCLSSLDSVYQRMYQHASSGSSRSTGLESGKGFWTGLGMGAGTAKGTGELFSMNPLLGSFASIAAAEMAQGDLFSSNYRDLFASAAVSANPDTNSDNNSSSSSSSSYLFSGFHTFSAAGKDANQQHQQDELQRSFAAAALELATNKIPFKTRTSRSAAPPAVSSSSEKSACVEKQVQNRIHSLRQQRRAARQLEAEQQALAKEALEKQQQPPNCSSNGKVRGGRMRSSSLTVLDKVTKLKMQQQQMQQYRLKREQNRNLNGGGSTHSVTGADTAPTGDSVKAMSVSSTGRPSRSTRQRRQQLLEQDQQQPSAERGSTLTKLGASSDINAVVGGAGDGGSARSRGRGDNGDGDAADEDDHEEGDDVISRGSGGSNGSDRIGSSNVREVSFEAEEQRNLAQASIDSSVSSSRDSHGHDRNNGREIRSEARADPLGDELRKYHRMQKHLLNRAISNGFAAAATGWNSAAIGSHPDSPAESKTAAPTAGGCADQQARAGGGVGSAGRGRSRSAGTFGNSRNSTGRGGLGRGAGSEGGEGLYDEDAEEQGEGSPSGTASEAGKGGEGGGMESSVVLAGSGLGASSSFNARDLHIDIAAIGCSTAMEVRLPLKVFIPQRSSTARANKMSGGGGGMRDTLSNSATQLRPAGKGRGGKERSSSCSSSNNNNSSYSNSSNVFGGGGSSGCVYRAAGSGVGAAAAPTADQQAFDASSCNLRLYHVMHFSPHTLLHNGSAQDGFPLNHYQKQQQQHSDQHDSLGGGGGDSRSFPRSESTGKRGFHIGTSPPPPPSFLGRSSGGGRQRSAVDRILTKQAQASALSQSQVAKNYYHNNSNNSCRGGTISGGGGAQEYDDGSVDAALSDIGDGREGAEGEEREGGGEDGCWEKEYRLGIYNAEERKIRLQRFMDKRKKRVWTRKVKYNVRKNFADSRIRVKGRFVRKDAEPAILSILPPEKAQQALTQGLSITEAQRSAALSAFHPSPPSTTMLPPIMSPASVPSRSSLSSPSPSPLSSSSSSSALTVVPRSL